MSLQSAVISQVKHVSFKRRLDNCQRRAYAGHVFRASRGINVLLMLEAEGNGTETRGWPGRNWIDDVKESIGLM